MASSNQNPAVTNMLARATLLQSGISMVKRLQVINGALGASVKIPLLRMGIMTGVFLQFTVPITIATSAAAVSSRGPWNLVNSIKYTDFAGTDRTRTTGYQLWAAQAMKQSDPLGAAMAAAYASGGAGPAMVYDTNILNQPTAVGNGNLQFSLYVPMAYDPSSDLTGAILTQTNVGEHYITVGLAGALSGTDPWIAPYLSTGGAVTLQAGASVEIDAYQCYIQPQNMSANSLPLIDLSTVYGFEGNYVNTANINGNQSTYLNYPNNRSIFSNLIDFENNGAFAANGADLSQITVVANSNTQFKEMSPRLLREVMRHTLGADLPPGSYYLSSRRQPIQTQLYAQVQAKMDVVTASNVDGPLQMVSQYEVQYPSGAPLPGITIAA